MITIDNNKFLKEQWDNLTGAEIDTVYKLFHYGSQDDGDLPSSCGMIELINKKLAIKNYNNNKPNMLTPKGYMLAFNIYNEK